jgi:hypothetical protein
MKRRSLLVGGACVLAAVIAVGALWLLRRPGHVSSAAIGARGGSSFVDTSLVGTVPHYTQTDERWRDRKLGPTSDPLASVGCTVCCLSMAMGHYGVQLPPDSLNALLTRGDGFTDRGWVKWEAIPAVTGDRVRIDVPGAPEYAAIDEALRNGHPVLAKILLHGVIQHWVLIVGKNGVEYLVNDPLLESTVPIPLSERAAHIESIRIVRDNRPSGA